MEGGSAVARSLFWRAFNSKKAALDAGDLSGGRWAPLWDALVFSKVRARVGGGCAQPLARALALGYCRLHFAPRSLPRALGSLPPSLQPHTRLCLGARDTSVAAAGWPGGPLSSAHSPPPLYRLPSHPLPLPPAPARRGEAAGERGEPHLQGGV